MDPLRPHIPRDLGLGPRGLYRCKAPFSDTAPYRISIARQGAAILSTKVGVAASHDIRLTDYVFLLGCDVCNIAITFLNFYQNQQYSQAEYFSTSSPFIQPLGTRSAYNTRSRKSIRGHIPMHNLLPVYIPCFLQALSLVHFISKIPIKE